VFFPDLIEWLVAMFIVDRRRQRRELDELIDEAIREAYDEEE